MKNYEISVENGKKKITEVESSEKATLGILVEIPEARLIITDEFIEYYYKLLKGEEK